MTEEVAQRLDWIRDEIKRLATERLDIINEEARSCCPFAVGDVIEYTATISGTRRRMKVVDIMGVCGIGNRRVEWRATGPRVKKNGDLGAMITYEEHTYNWRGGLVILQTGEEE